VNSIENPENSINFLCDFLENGGKTDENIHLSELSFKKHFYKLRNCEKLKRIISVKIIRKRLFLMWEPVISFFFSSLLARREIKTPKKSSDIITCCTTHLSTDMQYGPDDYCTKNLQNSAYLSLLVSTEMGCSSWATTAAMMIVVAGVMMNGLLMIVKPTNRCVLLL